MERLHNANAEYSPENRRNQTLRLYGEIHRLQTEIKKLIGQYHAGEISPRIFSIETEILSGKLYESETELARLPAEF